ncbi:unnamed protein product [Auanema sp. JU1783]|nr:unnamed protein product [Auanema sp. JU1783]
MSENQVLDNKCVTVTFPIDEGEPLGATPNEKLVITRVQKDSIAYDKLKIGDQIQELNGKKVTDCNHFFKLLRTAPPEATITLIRDEKKAAELQSRMHIPEERAKTLIRRDGFSYLIAKINWTQGGPKFGLGIKHYQNRVLVSRCDPGSVVSESLMVGDHILDVDSFRVTDKDVARDLLIKSLTRTGSVTCVIERPETTEAKAWTQQALSAQTNQPPSITLSSDVRNIAQRERTRLAENKQPARSILVGKDGFPASARVQIMEAPCELIIASDNDGRCLRAVKK